MKESDLYGPVKLWLENQGLRVYPEVPILHTPADVVGIGEREIVGVELKRFLTKHVLYQAVRLTSTCHRAYVAVGSRPRAAGVAQAEKLGIGVLVVLDSVWLHLAARVETPNSRSTDEIRRLCAQLTGEGVGGLPCLEGVGPAQDCKRRMDEYRKAHPKATWAEIYEKVPNHYANAKSMSQALTHGLALRTHLKKVRKEMRAALRKERA